MIHTNVKQTSYSAKNGYVWRKLYQKQALSISMQTRDEVEASKRSALMEIRFMQLAQLAVPFVAIRETLKAYRNELVMQGKIAFLASVAGNPASVSTVAGNPAALSEAPQATIAPQATQSPSIIEKVAVATLQRELDATEGHSLENTKSEWFKANTEWTQKTIKDYSSCVDRFIVWGTTQGITTVEAVTKDSIIAFKAYMDAEQLAPNTKQKILTRLGSMFGFAINVKEWIVKNPVSGLQYKKVGNVTKKEEVSPEQFNMVMSLPEIANDNQRKWAMALMYYTGMRVSELQQLTKADYIEIEGIKCISVNTQEEGKSTKTESSVRNIPLCDKLLAMGVWEMKPVMKYGVNSIMDKVSKSFKLISLKRTSHCFRHSMSNRLRDTNADDSTRAFILGHAQATMTDRVYVTREPLLKMQRALNEAN